MPGYDIIVVATDLSDPSLSAVRHGADLAAKLGSQLVLVYVMDDHLPPMILSQSAQSTDEILERHREHAKKSLADLVARHLPDRAVETVVNQGTPAKEIARLAAERGAGMIVVGMHGHGFMTHALAGSTAERVLHHAPCPVLVVSHSG